MVDPVVERAAKPVLEMVAVSDLRGFARNARRHSRAQVRKIADSIRAFGFNSPILVDGDNTILAGHGRLEAARLLNLAQVPCLRLSHMSEEQRRAFVLADNKLALGSSWDRRILGQELLSLSSGPLSFDVISTGFSKLEIASLTLAPAKVRRASRRRAAEAATVGDGADDEAEAEAGAEAGAEGAVPAPGGAEVWELGPHRLLCGRVEDQDIAHALGDMEGARVIVSDLREEDARLGRRLVEDFTRRAGKSGEGSLHVVVCGWRQAAAVQAGAAQALGEPLDLITWLRGDLEDFGRTGWPEGRDTREEAAGLFRQAHDCVFLFSRGSLDWWSLPLLACGDEPAANVWMQEAWVSLASPFGEARRWDGRRLDGAVHSLAGLLRDVTWPGGGVLETRSRDLWVLLAAREQGLRACLVAADEAARDAILSQWELVTGAEAVRSGAGQSGARKSELLDETAAERGAT